MKYLALTLILVSSIASAQKADSTLNTKCQKAKYACGECDTELQEDFDSLLNIITGNKSPKPVHWGDRISTGGAEEKLPILNSSIDKTLEDIVDLFKKHNPSGDHRLNFVVIGESESLQQTTIRGGKIHPRVMLKSPNSELMVTFNTDPNAKGYKTIEVMRWNGKLGRYNFQELNFGEGGAPPHVDVTGKKCLECHKSPSPRPNWDTYRAWAGVIPSRDDMLENKTLKDSFNMKKGFQPDADAYLNFLEQIARDKDGKKKGRLSLLDVPFDDKIQMKNYVKAAGKGRPLTYQEKIDLIKKKIHETGFYRIKHYPDSEDAKNNEKMAFNLDTKTATYAGPTQVSFDQMISQNMCKVATDLKKHPDFDKFKYNLALLFKCRGQAGMDDLFTSGFKKKVVDYYKKSNGSTLRDLDQKPKTEDLSFDQIQALLLEDTTKNHEMADKYKFRRHEKFMSSFLSKIEGFSPDRAKAASEYYSVKVVTPYQENFHAIEDPGGVRGVAEGHTKLIAETRLLLEPFGVNVSHWSLVHGKDNAYHSFSFSDQFVLLQEQKIFQDILNEAGSCENLEKKAIVSMTPNESSPVNPTDNDTILGNRDLCRELNIDISALTMKSSLVVDLLAPLNSVVKPAFRTMLKKCESCHQDGEYFEFKGLTDFIKMKDEKKFTNFLNTYNPSYKMTNVELMQYKLGAHSTNPYGSSMPPTDWNDNQEYASTHGVDPLNVQNIRRKELAIYLLMISNPEKGREAVRQMCGSINNESNVKEINAPREKFNKAGSKVQAQ